MSRYLIDEMQLQRADQRCVPCTRVIDGGGEGQLEWLCLENTETGERTTKEARGLFLLLGAEPRCDWLPPELARDKNSFVLTGRDVPRDQWVDGLPPANLATTVPGIFAAGDIRSGSMKRVAAASGEGASVVPLVHAFLAPAPEDAVAAAQRRKGIDDARAAPTLRHERRVASRPSSPGVTDDRLLMAGPASPRCH